MAIHVSCKFCNFSFDIDEKHAGYNIRCPKCSGYVNVPLKSSMQLDFVQETSRNCPLCSHPVSQDIEECSYCKGNIKNNEQIHVEQLPEIFKRPVTVKTYIGKIRAMLIFLILVGIGIGTLFVSKNRESSQISLIQLIPKDSKIIAIIECKRLSSLAKEATPNTQKVLQYFQDKIKFYCLQVFPKKLQINSDRLEQICVVAKDSHIFHLVDENLQDFSATLLLRGKFSPDAFQKYEKTASSEGFEEKYQEYSILKSQAAIAKKNEKIFFVLLDSSNLVASNKLDMVKQTIDIYKTQQKNTLEKSVQNFLDSSEVCKFYGEFPENFLTEAWKESVPVEYHNIFKINVVQAFLTQEKPQKIIIDAVFHSEDSALSVKKIVLDMEQDLIRKLPTAAVANAKLFEDALVNLQIHLDKEKLNVEGKLEESLCHFLTWIIMEQGVLKLRFAQEWTKIEKLDGEEKIKTLENFINLIKQEHYIKTHFYSNALELQRTLKEQRELQDLDEQARKKLEELTKGVSVDDEVIYWDTLQKFPFTKYTKTQTSQEILSKIKTIEEHLQNQLTKQPEELKVIIETKDFSNYTSLVELMKDPRPTILDNIARKNPIFNSLLREFRIQLNETQKELKNIQQATEQKYEQLKKDVTDFLENQYPKLIKLREFDQAQVKLQQFQREIKNLNKEKAETETAIKKAQTDLLAIRNLFSLAQEEIQKRTEVVTIVLTKGNINPLKGRIVKVGTKDFTLSDLKNHKHTIPFYHLTSSSLKNFIAPKQQTGEIWYYLGLLAFYEGKEKQAQQFLKDAKKLNYEPADLLLQKLQTR